MYDSKFTPAEIDVDKYRRAVRRENRRADRDRAGRRQVDKVAPKRPRRTGTRQGQIAAALREG